jgi:hypothetical protein
MKAWTKRRKRTVSFPKDILREIFSKIPHYENGNFYWLNILLVCKMWYSVGKEVFNPTVGRLPQQGFFQMVLRGNVQAVRSLLLDTRLDPTLRNYHAVITVTSPDKPSKEILQLLLQHPKMQKREEWIGEVLEEACSYRNFAIVNLLICKYPHPSMFNTQAIVIAAETGLTKCVRFLVRSGFDPTIDDNLPLKNAVKKNNKAVVRFLLRQKTVDPTDALHDRPSLKVLKLFFKYCPDRISKRNIDKILREACTSGKLRMVKFLLRDSRTDPSIENNICLERTVFSKQTDAVKLLLMDSRVAIPDGLLQKICRKSCSGIAILSLLLEDHRCNSSTIDFLELTKLAERGHNFDIVAFLKKFIQ